MFIASRTGRIVIPWVRSMSSSEMSSEESSRMKAFLG